MLVGVGVPIAEEFILDTDVDDLKELLRGIGGASPPWINVGIAPSSGGFEVLGLSVDSALLPAAPLLAFRASSSSSSLIWAFSRTCPAGYGSFGTDESLTSMLARSRLTDEYSSFDTLADSHDFHSTELADEATRVASLESCGYFGESTNIVASPWFVGGIGNLSTRERVTELFLMSPASQE